MVLAQDAELSSGDTGSRPRLEDVPSLGGLPKMLASSCQPATDMALCAVAGEEWVSRFAVQ